MIREGYVWLIWCTVQRDQKLSDRFSRQEVVFTYRVSSKDYHFISTAKPKPSVSVRSQSSVYTGDSVTLNCNLQSNRWTFFWYKDGRHLLQAPDTNTLLDTVTTAGVTEYRCIARRGNYDSEISDTVTVTVRSTS